MAKRRRRSRTTSRSNAMPQRPSAYHGEPELVVIVKAQAGLRATPEGLTSAVAAEAAPLSDILDRYQASMRPLFGASEERLINEASAVSAIDQPDLSTYYRVEAPPDRLTEIASKLRNQAAVEAAYVKPPAEPPQINEMAPSQNEAPPATADFSARQGYLDAAPGGVDARFAWRLAGGRGANVRIIDIEGAWRFSHEDLTQNNGGVVGGTPSNDIRWRNHGTAVIGEFSGDANGFGVTGICPDANVSAISIFGGMGSAPAIRAAANRLQPGDIILIELHRPGPRNAFENREDQHGYIAIEWWPDDFAAIQFATMRGIIVVEAAGNGSQNLDDPLYNTPAPGFPTSWKNPFNRANPDCGAILVGAGAPPPGTHGRNHGPDRSRLDFSNFGSAVDVQGWGREVTTCGYGDLQGGGNEDLWYTDRFSGTSSASPIVVGTLGSLQGVLRAREVPALTPARARQLLRATGSAQQDAPGRPRSQRIGNRPNLAELVAAASSEHSIFSAPAGGLTPAQRIVCERVINAFETGSVEGDYSNISIFEDGPNDVRQITYGRAQTTEYGNLRELVNMYVEASGLFSAGLREFVPRIGRVPLVDNASFKTLLRRAGAEDPVMRQTQDIFFDRRYFQPAMHWAEQNGFQRALSDLVIYDSFIHSGGILGLLRARFTEQPPAQGGDEQRWIRQYVDVRDNWLRNHHRPAVRASAYRTRDLRREIARDNWDLALLPINANGVRVDDQGAETRPPQAIAALALTESMDDHVPYFDPEAPTDVGSEELEQTPEQQDLNALTEILTDDFAVRSDNLSTPALAAQILRNAQITLATVHSSGVNDQATAQQNIADTAAGQRAQRSDYDGAPGGTVALNQRLLHGLLSLAEQFSFSISEIAGGSHSSNSRHYAGVAADINVINGQSATARNRHVATFKARCRSLGATEVLGPGDPGHSTHVHAAWPRPT